MIRNTVRYKARRYLAQSRTSAFNQSGVTNEDGIAMVLKARGRIRYQKSFRSGFGEGQQSVMVTPDNVQGIAFALAVAQREETVEVSGEPALVDASSSTPEAVVSRVQIAQMPGADGSNSLAIITTSISAPLWSMTSFCYVRGGHQIGSLMACRGSNTNIATSQPQFNSKILIT